MRNTKINVITAGHPTDINTHVLRKNDRVKQDKAGIQTVLPEPLRKRPRSQTPCGYYHALGLVARVGTPSQNAYAARTNDHIEQTGELTLN